MPSIRPERSEDQAIVSEIHRLAFPTDAEARLVAALRGAVQTAVSLVAEEDEGVVGHVMFTPVTVAVGGPDRAMGLAPLAVRPGHQGRGVGGALVRAGLEACRHLARPVVFVLGHPGYYARFGFEPAAPRGFRYKTPDFDPYFMVAELGPGALEGLSGQVSYHPLIEAA